MRKTIIGSGVYNLDAILVREYPAWPAMRPFVDRPMIEEVGGTCGNVMSILAHLGWESFPEASLDDSPEGMKVTEDRPFSAAFTRRMPTVIMLWPSARALPEGAVSLSGTSSGYATRPRPSLRPWRKPRQSTSSTTRRPGTVI